MRVRQERHILVARRPSGFSSSPVVFWGAPAPGGLHKPRRRGSPPTEGPPQKKSTDPPLKFAKSPTHPPTIRLFFLTFFLVRLWAFLGKGSSKTPRTYFGKTSVSKTFPKISTKISMSVFPRLPLFYRVFGCFLAMGVQKHYKKRFTKKIASKSFLKKIDHKSKTDFFSNLLLSRFWAFFGDGSSKTR
jgi:hypothetical protein